MFEFIIIALLIAAIAVWFFGRPKFEQPKTAPSDQRTYDQFEAVPSLFVNRTELGFFHALRRDLPAGYSVHSKVRLEDIICVRPTIKNPEARWKLRARVKSRHVDFLVVDEAGGPVLGIELDGAVHQTPETFNADTLKNGLFKAAGIPLERIPADADSLGAARTIALNIGKYS